MISQTAQYALRAIVCLASHPQSAMTVGALADMTRVPPKYLSKVMQALVRADLVISKPGKMGGFSLKVPAETLSLLTVIEAIDTPMHEEPYPLELRTYGNILCPLHQRLDELIAHVRKEFNTITIRDLLP